MTTIKLSDEVEWKIDCMAAKRHDEDPYLSYEQHKEYVTNQFVTWLFDKFVEETTKGVK
jgi:predicted transcriptional regulator